jgi:flagellar L-ring protein precursor FlgH
MKREVSIILSVFAALALTTPAVGQKFSAAKSLEEYIREAKANQEELQTSGGSLYTPAGINSSLFSDLKARHVNDLITIRVVESTTAQSSANAQTNRTSTTDLSVPNFFGLENHNPSIPFGRLVTANTDMKFKGDGSTQRTGNVLALMSGRVTDVLPNGNMVIEAVKEVKVNNERQVLRLFGVVRPIDVAPNNVVLSGAVANMLLQIDGKGVLSDNLKQGWLFHLLTKVWPF